MFNSKIVKNQLVKWIKDFFALNASKETKAVIGISGGKDSSIIAALCKEALGRDRVLGVLMPDGDQEDIDIAYRLCALLDIPFIEININNSLKSLYKDLEKTGLSLNDAAVFNTPARIRMTVLYAVSAIVGGRVANTGNLSEDYVGYSTKFGDMAGDFSPFANLTVTEVKAVGRELGLDSVFVDKIPADGLSGYTDEENLGFTYEALDRYIRESLCEDEKTKEMIESLHRNNAHKNNPIPSFQPHNV